MKAVAITRYLPVEDPQSLLDVTLDKPVPKGHDLLVSVKAIAVNPVDTKVRSPKDKVEDKPRVLGWDAAGIVEAVGPDVHLFKPGDKVFYAGDITRPGTNSELHLIDERIVGSMPASLSFDRDYCMGSVVRPVACADATACSSKKIDFDHRRGGWCWFDCGTAGCKSRWFDCHCNRIAAGVGTMGT
jgi:NADPH:quinone reductase-like Zn-dependent oxidoreductase